MVRRAVTEERGAPLALCMYDPRHGLTQNRIRVLDPIQDQRFPFCSVGCYAKWVDVRLRGVKRKAKRANGS